MDRGHEGEGPSDRRRIRYLLAYPRRASRGAGVGAAMERRAARHLPRHVPQGARPRHAEADGLAHLAHQLVRAVLSRRAGLSDVHAVLRLSEGGDVPQLRRAADGSLHPEHQLDALRRPHARTDDRNHLSPTAVPVRSAARQTADRRLVCRLCAAGDPSRRRRRRCGEQDEDLAGHRNRRAHWRRGKEDDAGRRLRRSEGNVRCRRERHHPVEEVLGDAARQPARRRPRRSRDGQARMGRPT